jgi:hypothetical protein
VRLGRVTSIARISGEHAVGQRPQPLSIRLMVDHRGSHRDSTEDDVRMGSEVVIPSWVPGAPGVRCRNGDSVSIVKVDDRIAAPRTTSRTLRLEHGGGEDERRSQAAMGRPQEDRIEPPANMTRYDPGKAGGAESCIQASEYARPTGRIDMSEADDQRESPPISCRRADACAQVSGVASVLRPPCLSQSAETGVVVRREWAPPAHHGGVSRYCDPLRECANAGVFGSLNGRSRSVVQLTPGLTARTTRIPERREGTSRADVESVNDD